MVVGWGVVVGGEEGVVVREECGSGGRECQLKEGVVVRGGCSG